MLCLCLNCIFLLNVSIDLVWPKAETGRCRLHDELDNSIDIRVIISKLPYKMRESWRNAAYDIHEMSARRARSSDLVQYINCQAKVKNTPCLETFRS